MKVWLRKKYADRLDGIDLSEYQVGDTLDLTTRDARLLMAEEWASPERRVRSRAITQKRRVTDYDLRSHRDVNYYRTG